MPTKRIIIYAIAAFVFILAVLIYFFMFSAPQRAATAGQFIVSQDMDTTDTISGLLTKGFIRSHIGFEIIFRIRNPIGTVIPGGYDISKSMNAWELAGVLSRKPSSVWVTIPEGLRKEEIADILSKKLDWSAEQETEWITKDTTTNPDYTEGVYFPDTYLIPYEETPLQTVKRLQTHFEDKFAPYARQAAQENIKWTTTIKLASIIQREAGGKEDMPLVSGILWNRLLKNMKLQADSTVQYARGKTSQGWWAPIKPADELLDSPYNTYLHAGLPPHPISNPGLDAISAALNPGKTQCIYYIHDSSGTIHCAVTYQEQLDNIQKYLK